MSNQSTTETTDAKRYVIRANGAADYIYWSDDEPYVEHGIKYEWRTHPTLAAVFEDAVMAGKFASFQPKHVGAHVVDYKVALENHPSPVTGFPFSHYAVPTDAEFLAATA